MALRLMVNPNPDEISAEEFITITQTDIEKIFARKRPKGVKLPIDEALLHESLAKLNALMGLDNIKAEVNEQVKLVRYYLEIGKDVHTAFSTHTVFSGVTVMQGQKIFTEYERTNVRFRELTEREIFAYIETGEPMDKAGAYGAQGIGSLFVEGIEGDFFNVMGLPLCRLSKMLEKLGVILI